MVKRRYFTGIILEWKHHLKPAKYKRVIIESLKLIVKVKAFTIMSNHIHLIGQIQNGCERESAPHDFFEISFSNNY
jgi:REP element-mobilizing transposase RayT